MSENNSIDEEKAPKRQATTWVIAALLGGALLALNLWPSSDDSPVEQPVVATASPTPSATQAVEHRQIEWPEFDLAKVVQSNPFEMRSTLAEEAGNAAPAQAGQAGAGDSTNGVLARELDVRNYPVHMIFHSPRGRSALIGAQVVEVGDEIDGMRVVEIAQAGVTLTPID